MTHSAELTVSNLSHQYVSDAGATPVLHDISFTLAKGEQLLLRGISGSGKTTLINILAGLLTPSSGRVELAAQNMYALGEAERDTFRREQIGYVFQTHHLLPILSSWENVAMPLAFVGLPKRERKAKALALLEAVGLADRANNRPSQLSNGQRQRVAIARALANEPAFVLADEPTASLDESSAEIVLDLLQETCQARGATLLLASHDPTIATRFSRSADLIYGSWQESRPQVR